MNEMEQWCLKKCTDILNTLGRGHRENIYHNAFIVELRESTYSWESEKVLPILYKGIQVGFVRSDIVIDNKLVLEFKSITKKLSENDIRQVQRYMDVASVERGLIINFGNFDEMNKTVEFMTVPTK